MASVWKHPKSRFWTGCFTDETGKQRKNSTKMTNPEDAQIVADGWEEAAKKARDRRLSEIQSRKILTQIMERTSGGSIEHQSFRHYSDRWLKDVDITRDGDSPNRYRPVIVNFIKSLGARADLPIDEITTRDLQDFANARLADGFSSKTVQVDIRSISSCFSSAVSEGLLQRNPASAVKLPKVVSKKKEIFSIEELKKIIESAGEDWKTAALLGYYTSQRLSDCASIRRGQLNFENRSIKFIQGKTKTEVFVPMHDRLFEHLLQFEDKPADFVLCPDLAERPTGGNYGLSRLFQDLMISAGVDPKRQKGHGKKTFAALTYHSLRHSFNSHLAARGVSKELRMKITGHKSEAVNDGYTHLKLEELRGSVALLPAI